MCNFEPCVGRRLSLFQFFVLLLLVFIISLSHNTNIPVLKEAFEQHGEIIEVKVICDHRSGKSKGYGFVQFMSEKSASTALEELNGQMRNIRVFYAKKDG
ncbi:hypothetical protein MKW92_012388 [Papaver armeniacum]|nr:hypothetical protein MKW92_012388 [Papaver armeniacum]